MDAGLFWNRVKPLIKEKGLTQASFAEKCGISFGTFQGWIAKSVLPSVVDGYKIADALNTSVEYLVTGIDSNPAAAELAELKGKLRAILDD